MTDTTLATPEQTTAARRPTRRTRLRRAALGLAAGAAAAGVLAIPASASADSDGRVVQLGPGIGIQCVSGFASVYADGFGAVTDGPGANFQLRYYGSQVLGSGTQVSSFRAVVQPGLPGWRGPGFYQFCARNNTSYATAYISLYTF